MGPHPCCLWQYQSECQLIVLIRQHYMELLSTKTPTASTHSLTQFSWGKKSRTSLLENMTLKLKYLKRAYFKTCFSTCKTRQFSHSEKNHSQIHWHFLHISMSVWNGLEYRSTNGTKWTIFQKIVVERVKALQDVKKRELFGSLRFLRLARRVDMWPSLNVLISSYGIILTISGSLGRWCPRLNLLLHGWGAVLRLTTLGLLLGTGWTRLTKREGERGLLSRVISYRGEIHF